MILICKNCEKEFEWKNSQKQYCSEECKQIAKNNRVLKEYFRKCPTCGTDFIAHNARAIYCSNKCKIKQWNSDNPESINCICDYCGKEFIRTYNNYKNTHCFCSIECSARYKNKYGIGTIYNCKYCGKEFNQVHKRHYFCSNICKLTYNKENAPTKKVNCSNCGKIIERLRHLKNKHFFCSIECESNFRINEAKDIRYCETCGKDFSCKKGETLRFCSVECQGIWQAKERIGKNSSGYNFEYSDDMRIKKCENCGKEMFGTPVSFKTQKFCSRKCAIVGNNKTMTKPHRDIADFLINENIGIECELQIGRYSADIHLLNTDFLIEINGTYWHSDVRFYLEPERKEGQKGIARDKRKRERLLKEGYKILYLWEYDIENEKKTCSQLIYEFIEKNGILNNYHSMNYSLIDNNLKLNNNILIPFQDL